MACLLLNKRAVLNKVGNRRKKNKLAKEFILKHLEQNARAGDTLAGITKCWLEQARIEIAVEEVAHALTEMIKEGRIKAHELGGETFFFKNQAVADAKASESAD